MPDCDVIIIGSGPAGVSAAYPLVQEGLRVLMVDGGKQPSETPPMDDFLIWRSNQRDQFRLMVGDDFQALKMQDAVSPKFRVPSLNYVFDDFAHLNKVFSPDFIAVGSLATGGLSNAWGCGVARLSGDELVNYPFPGAELEASYETVSKRIGISGAVTDDLSEYFGLDAWSQAPIALDTLHAHMLKRYTQSREKLNLRGFALGRSRVAVISENLGNRIACERSGNCLWGCQRGALYSAADEVTVLNSHNNFTIRKGFVVDSISNIDGLLAVQSVAGDGGVSRITTSKIMMAAGTLASTRLIMKAINYDGERDLLSCPTAAFLAWLPRYLGTTRTAAFGLGQLSFRLDLSEGVRAMGSTFSTTGIPASDFIRHVPLHNRYAADILCNLLSSCVVGNVFLPGELGAAKAKLDAEGRLVVTKLQHDSSSHLFALSARLLRRCFYKLGALVIPGSFTIGKPGADIHYAGTLPMRHAPRLGETSCIGEVKGLSGVYVVDGACLSSLSEKSHTLTIMANADRIAGKLAKQIKYS